MRSPTVADRSERGVPIPEGWATLEANTKAQDATHVGNHGEAARLRAASASRAGNGQGKIPIMSRSTNSDSVTPSGRSDDELALAQGGESASWSLAPNQCGGTSSMSAASTPVGNAAKS